MLGLLSLAARLALAHAARRMAQASALFAAAGVFAIIALIGFAAALWIWLAHLLGPIGAALLVGGVALVLALIFGLLARAKLRTASPLQSPAAQALLAELKAHNAEASLFTLLGPALGAALLGMFLGGKPKE
ncbi:phage holin family protein [Cypionkella psychrotolerans]|uniref:phage holin family protein n=1 Tax=Cypionkella psychrotolerans TaxID=1678131 RepID=UPI0006B6633D|nr:phage holin family protein [Cypionkella psychrotolerans]